MTSLVRRLVASLHLFLCAPLVVACSAGRPTATPASASASVSTPATSASAATPASTAATVAAATTKAVTIAKSACAAGELLHTIDPTLFRKHPALQAAETVCETLAP